MKTKRPFDFETTELLMFKHIDYNRDISHLKR